MIRQVKTIYDSKNKRQSIERFDKFYFDWQKYEPYAIKCFRDGFHDTLHYFEFGEGRHFISSTNHLERYLEEVRRRIKIQGYFKNERSVNLWIFGLIKHINLRPIQQPKRMLQCESAK